MYSCPNTVIYTLQILKEPSGGKGKLCPRITKQEQSITLWQYTGHLCWPPPMRNSMSQRWIVILPSAHRTTEVPQIGLTPRSTLLLPHNSSHCFAFQGLIDALPRHTPPPFPLPHPLPPKTLSHAKESSLVCLRSLLMKQTDCQSPPRKTTVKRNWHQLRRCDTSCDLLFLFLIFRGDMHGQWLDWEEFSVCLSDWQIGRIISSRYVLEGLYCGKNYTLSATPSAKVVKNRKGQKTCVFHVLPHSFKIMQSGNLLQFLDKVAPKCGVYYQYKWKYIPYYLYYLNYFLYYVKTS